MVALLISWVFAGWISLVFGLAGSALTASLLHEDRRILAKAGPDYVFLLGFMLITSLVSIASIFMPVNGYLVSAFALAGAGLTYWLRADLAAVYAGLRSGWKGLPWPVKVVILTVFLMSMCAVILEFGESDVWFYHSQSIKWIREYAVVPGLGNVHGRFAFNSHFFISSAFFTLWFSSDHVVFSLASLFFFLFITRLVVLVQSNLAAQRWADFILYSILALACTFQLFPEIHGTSTDGISAMILLYALLFFMDRPVFEASKMTGLLFFWMLIMTAVTFKLSSVFAGVILLFTLKRLFAGRRLLAFAGAGLLILAPFITRNIILSGYLLYPVPQLDVLSVDWKIPMEEVILEKNLVSGWAKLPSGGAVTPIQDIPKVLSMPFVPWFKAWWPNQSLKWQAIMIIDLFTVFLAALALYRRKYTLAIVNFTVAFNLVFWFLEAPRPRFGFAFLFLGLGLVLSWVGAPAVRRIKPNQFIFLLFPPLMMATSVLKNGVRYTEHFSAGLLWMPDYFQVRTEPLIFQAENFTLNMPPAEPPAKGIWCYNLPLPCTPFPKQNLMMRGSDYQDGFRVDTKFSQQTHISNQ